MSLFVIFWLIPPLPLRWWRHLWTAPYMWHFFICDAVFEMWSARIESGARCEIEFYFPVDIKDVTKCPEIPIEENMPLNWHISPVKIMYAIIFHFFAKTWLSKLTHYVRYFVILQFCNFVRFLHFLQNISDMVRPLLGKNFSVFTRLSNLFC